MDLHRGKHSIKDWCKSLKNQVTRAIKYKQKDMEPLTSEERKTHRVAKKCHICIKMFKKEDAGDSFGHRFKTIYRKYRRSPAGIFQKSF